MGLVKCPECGRENVSDMAPVCPNCGFTISNYFHPQQNTMNNQQVIQQPNIQYGGQFNQPNNGQYPPQFNGQFQQQFNGQYNMPQQQPTGSNKAVVIGVLVALFVVIGIVLAFVFTSGGGSSSKYDAKKYVESDEQMCRTIRIAMETAATDAAVANEIDYKPFKTGDNGRISDLSRGGKVYMSSFCETLGIDKTSELSDYISTTLGRKEGDFSYYWVSDSTVVVYIDNTNKNGSKKEPHTLSSTNCQCIYSGPVELYDD